MDEFLDICEQKLNQDQILNLKRPTTPSKIVVVIESFLTKIKPKARWIQHRILTDLQRGMPILLKLWHKIEREGTLPNFFMRP